MAHTGYAEGYTFAGCEDDLIFEIGDAHNRTLFVHGGPRLVQEECSLWLARASKLRSLRGTSFSICRDLSDYVLRRICLYAVVSQVLVTAACLAALIDYGTRVLEWSCDSDRYIADAFRHNLGRYSLPSSTLLVHSVTNGDRHFPAHWYELAEFPSGFYIMFRPEVSYPFLQGRNSTYEICTFDPRLGSSMSCDHIAFGYIIRAPTW